jgi:sporulation protein YlmC with PRC-barrel domain
MKPCGFVRGHDGLNNTTQFQKSINKTFKMKTTKTLAKRAALIAVLILGSSAWVSAQTKQGQLAEPEGGPGSPQDNQTGVVSTNSQSSQLMKINKGSSLIGATVKNQQGEELGKISDLVIDFNSDRVAYVVLNSETGLFSAAKLHAVPLNAFQPDSEGACLILNADKAKLDHSEGFDKNNWPAATTATWGAEPFWKDAQGSSSAQEGRDVDQQKIKIEPKIIEPQKTEPLSQP